MASNTPATDIAGILQEKNVGTIGKDLFIGESAPPKPDFVITVHDTGTYREDSPNLKYKYPTVQTIVRDTQGAYQHCWAIINGINEALHGYTSFVFGGSAYVLIFNISGPMNVGYDSSRRPIFSANFRIMRKES